MKLKTVAQNLKARFNEEFCQGNRKRRKRYLVFSPLDSVLSDASCIYLLLYVKHGPLRKQRNNFEICICIYLLLYLKHGPLVRSKPQQIIKKAGNGWYPETLLLILVQWGVPNNNSLVDQKYVEEFSKSKMAAMKYWITMNISQTINIFNNHKEQNLFKMPIYIYVANLKFIRRKLAE